MFPRLPFSIDSVVHELPKPDALEMVFQVYKPRGTDLHDSRKSTWMHPIVNGVDAIKLVGKNVYYLFMEFPLRLQTKRKSS